MSNTTMMADDDGVLDPNDADEAFEEEESEDEEDEDEDDAEEELGGIRLNEFGEEEV